MASPELLHDIHEPALFWLDGHYSGGFTARGDKETPVEAELRAILAHPVKGHVILIDDARCFTGVNDYPPISAMQRWVQEANAGYTCEVDTDIIRILPSPQRGGIAG